MIAPFLLAIIVFLYPIPESGTIRNILFLSIIILIIATQKHNLHHNTFTFLRHHTHIKYPIIALYILTSWLFIQTSMFAVDRTASFNNLLEEWVLGTIIFSWLAWKVTQISICNSIENGSTITTLMLTAMFAHIVWLFWHQIPIWQNSGHYPYGSTPYAQRDFASFPINLAFIVLVADLASFISIKKRVLVIPLWVSTLFMLFSTAAVIAVHTRNGVLSAVAALLLLAITAGHKLWHDKRKAMALAMVIAPFMIITALAITTINTDGRWAGFWETVKVSTDIENNRAWLDSGKYPYPKTESGAAVDASAYLRIAWGSVAIEGIKKHPLGYGYGLGALGKYVEEEYGRKGFVSSHSGILDFTLANGIPGAVLWILFSISLLWSGWLLFMRGNPFGLLLILMLANFFTRTVLDGHFGGFRLKIFALLIGVIFCVSAYYKKPSS